jgi:Adenine-specific methyltransferase EcoRI
VADINGDGRINKYDTIRTLLSQNGDFRSPECIEILREVDIVVTNPPFSLFREYVGQLFEYGKKFLIIGNQNAITYKDFFPFIQKNKVWFGHSIHSGDREFRVPDSYPLNSAGNRVDENGKKYIRVKGVRWFTNLDYKERHEDLLLYKRYSPEEYPKYGNYDAINVNITKDIPMDYTGYM